MAEKRDLAGRLEALEARLRIPEKQKASAAAAEAGQALAKALSLPDRVEVSKIGQQIASLGDRNDVVVEWRVRDVESASGLAAVSCACCCCCCCVIVA